MRRLLYPLALALAACDGDDRPGDVDARPASDAVAGDAGNDACYREANDRGNGASPEPTGLAFGVGRVAICGAVDIDHPGAAYLDIDRFEIAVSSTDAAVLRVAAPAAGALDRLDVVVRTGTTAVAVARVHGGVGLTLLPLGPGLYTVAVEAKGPSAVAVPYQLELMPDEPSRRCPIPDALVADYAEVETAASGHRANDVLSIRTAPAVVTRLTVALDDEPEDTVLAVSAGGHKLVTGTSADVLPVEDPYHDRDTFSIYTGQSTNLLEVRAAWPQALADLDLFVFEADHADDPMGRPARALTGELLATAVKPSTRYWIWVGGEMVASRADAAYTLAICGAELAIGADL